MGRRARYGARELLSLRSYAIPLHDDSRLGKLIERGETRTECLKRLCLTSTNL
jgi:hypothetical protein